MRNIYELIRSQIVKYYQEILFIRFIFCLANCLSVYFIIFTIESLYSTEITDSDLYIKFLEIVAALFAPYLTIVAQGYCYPKSRNINTLKFFLIKRNISNEEKSIIYGK